MAKLDVKGVGKFNPHNRDGLVGSTAICAFQTGNISIP